MLPCNTKCAQPEHRIGGLPILKNSFSIKLSLTGSGIGGPPIPSLEFFWRRLSLGQLKALLCHVSVTPYFYNLCEILGIGGPPIPYHEGSTAHFVFLGTLLFNVYLLYLFYVPLGIGGPPIPGTKSMQSCSSETVFHQFSTSTMKQVSDLSCLSILLLAATTAKSFSSAHSPETPPDVLFSTFQVQTPLTQLSDAAIRSGPSLSARMYTTSKLQPTLKCTHCSMGDGAQQRRGQPEREACKVEKREMEAPGGSGGMSMRACKNGGVQPPVAAQ